MAGEEEFVPGFERVEILGEKVRLRGPLPADAGPAYKLVKNEAVLSSIHWDGPASLEEMEKTYSRWQRDLKSGQGLNLTIETADKAILIGSVGLRFPRHPLQADIGYWLGEPYWNGGYMTEAVRLICHLAFQYLNSVRVYATVFKGNIGSSRVLEKNGFSLDGTMRGHIDKRGQWLDGWFFSLLRDEWQARREYYEPRQADIVPRDD